MPGAAEAVGRLRDLGKQVGVVTNNSGQSPDRLRQALSDLGIEFSPREIVSAVRATADWLTARGTGKTAFVLGSDGLMEELRRSGIACVEAPETVGYRCDYLVVGACRQVNYHLLTRALRVGLDGACYVAVNKDRTFPGSEGLYPGAGAIVGAVSSMLGREPDAIIGKPSPHLAQFALRLFGSEPRECLLVGDTLETDIAMGRAVGMDTALVLTGNSRAEEIRREAAPTYVLESVAALGCSTHAG